MAVAVQEYSYARSSGLDVASGRLDLATSGGMTRRGLVARPRFFSGLLTRAAPSAAGLLAVADVAKARYDRPRSAAGWAASRDPVVTCNGDRLRFESFSMCGGVYARLDLLRPALDGEIVDLGTTNVDVNARLREALARLGGSDPLHLAVGADELVVTTLDGAVVEKKVPLPDRWIRGLAEVQVIASRFDLRAELGAAEAVTFLRGLPMRGVLWMAPAGRTLRVSTRPGAICLPGPGRLATMLPLLRFARALRVYGPVTAPVPGLPTSSAWELELPGMRYVIMLSPDPRRGFSGEGAVLDHLASGGAETAASDAELIGALLCFQPRLEADELQEESGLDRDRVRAALTRLGTSGRVGYDLAEAAHFHRELPYDAARVASANPRLRAALKLADEGAVRFTAPDAAEVGERRVRLTPAGATCTCPWWVDYRGTRGPCKHVLAAQRVRNLIGAGA
ncbi:SWIM zinc finger family protein [Streptosporangiaceae bacterium NEAU-GS5]|nr:SWIM zinc finger family protein [Streptosporangiaceae bacterium NEAU-GS5]